MSNPDHNAIATAICRSVAEIGDRNSPADWPEAMLVTSEELHAIVLAQFEESAPTEAAAMAATVPAGPVAWRERMRSTDYWHPCTKVRHDDVLRRPHLWPTVEVQALIPAMPTVAPPTERTKQERTQEVLDRLQRLEDGHNRNPFRPLLERLMASADSFYSVTEIGQMKHALDGFYGAPQPPRPGTAPLSDEQVDEVLSALIPGGSHARDWFLPHEQPRGLANVRDVVRAMLKEAARFGHPTTPTPKDPA